MEKSPVVYHNEAFQTDDDKHRPTVQQTTQGQPVEEVNEDCGYCCLRLPCLNICRSAKIALLFFCFAGATQGMLVNGFINSLISTIETRFGLSSKESGIIVVSYDIATVICLIPLTYFGGNGCKPRWIASGVFLMGIGSIIFAIPHFTAAAHVIAENGTEIEQLCSLTEKRSACLDSAALANLVNYKYVFILAQLLHGVGASPLYTLCVTYLDENLKTKLSSLYVGIFYMMSIIGPAIGYVLGGTFLNVYTDFHRIDTDTLSITTSSPNWVGAWWLGFLMTGVFSLLLTAPILAFPKSLPGSLKLQAERVSEAHSSSAVTPSGTSLRDAPRALLNLLLNPTFMLLNIAGASEGFLVAATSTFAPKFIEAQFNLTASWAGQLMGFATVPAGGGGMFIGGFIVKKFDMKCRAIIKFCICISIVSLLTIFIFLMRCPQTSFVGINTPYHMNMTLTSNSNLTDSCNANCHCDLTNYDPVCSDNKVTYFSSCLAGCRNTTVDDGDVFLHDCSCINSSPDGTGMLKGICKSDCKLMAVFLPLFAVLILFTFISAMPSLAATLRSVPEKQRSFCLGIQWLFVRCLGTIPGPIALGSLIDSTCDFWQPTCSQDGERGACRYYDNAAMSNYMLMLGLIGKTLTLICFSLSLKVYKPPPPPPSTPTNVIPAVTSANTSSNGVTNQAAELNENTKF